MSEEEKIINNIKEKQEKSLCIEDINNLLDNCKNSHDEYVNIYSDELGCFITKEFFKDIETLLDLYNKEKQENEYLNTIIESDNDNYINKDKIREKIKILEEIRKEEEKTKFVLSYSIYDFITNEIDELKELLEE